MAADTFGLCVKSRRYTASVTLHALSARAAALSPSPTLSISARANAMKAQGLDVISFGAGEPDFNTPEPICRAAIDAIGKGKTKYTPTAGIAELREAAAEKLFRENGVKVAPDQIVVSCGAKHSLFNALMCLVDPGDEVLLPTPCWMTYGEQIRLAGGIPVPVLSRVEDGFVPRIEDLESAVTSKTRALVMNSPCNPTGAVFPRQTIKDIMALAIRRGLWVISDEIYEKLIYDGDCHTSPASLSQGALERTVTVQGCSKSFAMTGWRIGYAAAPLEVVRAMSNLQDQVTSNPTSFAQYGALAALQMPAGQVEDMRREFEARRDLLVERLNAIPGLDVPKPRGAFYALTNVRGFLQGQIRDDVELASFLLEKAHVAVIPGSVFGGEGCLRLSYATSQENIRRGVERIGDALQSIRP
jgi:aspartate aminotransferase